MAYFSHLHRPTQFLVSPELERILRGRLASHPRRYLEIKGRLLQFDALPLRGKRLNYEGEQWGIESVSVSPGALQQWRVRCVELTELNKRHFHKGVVNLLPNEYDKEWTFAFKGGDLKRATD